jgi:hypothetical protein
MQDLINTLDAHLPSLSFCLLDRMLLRYSRVPISAALLRALSLTFQL